MTSEREVGSMLPEQDRSDSRPDGGADVRTPTGPDDAHAIPHLEFDESVPPRPEEEIADATRAHGPE